MSLEVLNSLDDIRVTTQAVLNDQKLSAKRVDQVEVNTRPVRLVSFDFFGDSALAEDLINLNKDINVSYYSGEVDILTA